MEGSVAYANPAACTVLGKSLGQIQGFQGGEVFECEYARLPEGCGNTMHCSACTIRNTVMATVKTGKPNRLVPAFLSQDFGDGSRRIDFLISTEKKGGVVFLKIDEMNEASLDKSKESDKQ